MNKALLEAIHNARRILLITHIDPDGDAIGSLLGLGLALEKKGKRVVMACDDPVPSRFAYLPGSQRVTPSPYGSFDLIIALDASDRNRLGKAYAEELYASIPLVNIDHHITNLHFGTINWVDPKAAATAEMVLELVEALEIPLDVQIATCLLHGIISDTRGFRTPNTTPEVLEATVKLQKAGAPLVEVMEHIFNRRPLNVLRLWGKVLNNVRMEGRIIWAEIPRSLVEELGLESNSDYGLVNVMVGVNEADVAVIFTEKPNGDIDVGMRSIPGIDVSQVAVSLGGGGHPQAAGCRLRGRMPEVREKVLKRLAEFLDKHKT